MQLPLYALAVERSIVPGTQVIDGQYISIHSGEPIGRLFSGRLEELERRELFDHVESLVGEFVQRIKQGNFTVNPSSYKACSRCQHKMICRIQELDPDKRAGETELEP